MNDAMMVLIISTTVVTIVQAIFWRWVSSVSDNSKDNAKKLESFGAEMADLRAEIYRDYPSKSDVHMDNQKILDSLKELKSDVKQLSDKLDKKVDK